MKLFLSYIFYVIGDIISRTTMQFFNGLGFGVYQKVMLLSVDLDTEGKIWKYVKPKYNKRKRK